ncbi:MAG: hypothetical protein WBA74_22055 [Cyclobacteriaceae bacterium]
MMELKENIIRSVENMLREKANEMNKQLMAVRSDAGSGGKSSMGDKYETTREMLKQEEEKIAGQLEMCNKQLTQVANLQLKRFSQVESGALVRTGNLYFMILTSLGKITVSEKEIFVISAIAPVSKQMLGKSVGDQIIFNRENHQIDEIC